MLQIRGNRENFFLKNQNFVAPEFIKDLGIFVTSKLNFLSHIDERIKEANKVFYSVRRNVFDSVYDAELAVPTARDLLACLSRSICLSRASLKNTGIISKTS